MKTRMRVSTAAALFAIALTACAPAVPDLRAAVGDSAAGAAVTTTSTTEAPTTTSTLPTTTTSSTTTSTAVPAGANEQSVGSWTLAPEARDQSGDQFDATVTVPMLSGDVDAALQARVTAVLQGHVESQIGATLALWRSIEGQGDRDLTGSTLSLDYEVAAFTPELISLRFFSEERVSGSGGGKRQVTTLIVDLANGIAVGLDDIVLDGDSRASLLPLVQAGLLTGYFNGDEDAFSLWAGNLTPADLDSAALSADGLEIWFDELEVGPPEMGLPVVVIGYDELEGLIDPTFTAALADA